MTTSGDVVENPVTGERATVRVRTAETDGAERTSSTNGHPGTRAERGNYRVTCVAPLDDGVT